jgi:hypothetical protein
MNTATLRPHRGDLALNLSILALYFFPLGIVAWILGSRDLALMNAGVMDPAGRGTVQCARIVGLGSAITNFVVFLAILAIAALLVLAVIGVRALI